MQPATNYIIGNWDRAGSDLPPSQYDRRNITGTRFIEVSAAVDSPQTVLSTTTPPITVSADMTNYKEYFSYNEDTSFRVFTIGLESFSIRHYYDGITAANGFQEVNREPIAIDCQELTNPIGARYLTLCPSDYGQGLAGAISISRFDLPSKLTFVIGLVNPIASDETIYSPNATRVSDPVWTSQFIKSITVRFWVRANYERNLLGVYGLPGANKGVGISVTEQSRFPGGAGANNRQTPPSLQSLFGGGAGDGAGDLAQVIGRIEETAGEVLNAVGASSLAIEEKPEGKSEDEPESKKRKRGDSGFSTGEPMEKRGRGRPPKVPRAPQPPEPVEGSKTKGPFAKVGRPTLEETEGRRRHRERLIAAMSGLPESPIEVVPQEGFVL